MEVLLVQLVPFVFGPAFSFLLLVLVVEADLSDIVFCPVVLHFHFFFGQQSLLLDLILKVSDHLPPTAFLVLLSFLEFVLVGLDLFLKGSHSMLALFQGLLQPFPDLLTAGLFHFKG